MERNKAERLATEFFLKRFPQKDIEMEKITGYFYEWVDRFESGHPEWAADNESLKIIQQLTLGGKR